MRVSGETVSDSIAEILEREPDWSLLPASTPPAIRRLLLRCLTKDPKRRLRDIGDVRLEIDAADEGDAGKAETTAPPAARLVKWLPWVALVALAAVLVIREPPAPVSTAASLPDQLERGWSSRRSRWEGSSEWDAAITSDGKRVAFLSDHAGEIDILERSVDWRRGADQPRRRIVPRCRCLASCRRSAITTTTNACGSVQSYEEAKRSLMKDGKVQPFLSKLQQAPTWSNDRRLAFFTQRKIGVIPCTARIQVTPHLAARRPWPANRQEGPTTRRVFIATIRPFPVMAHGSITCADTSACGTRTTKWISFACHARAGWSRN